MKIGIIGLPQAGKTTVFEALTMNFADTGGKSENRLGTVTVPDSRVDVLSGMYKPRKTIYAQVEYFLPGGAGAKKDSKADQSIWNQVRDCDALVHVIRNFSVFGQDEPRPAADFTAMDQELILSDLVVVEKRLERLDADKKRGKPFDPEEEALLAECLKHLENEEPLRRFSELAGAPKLRGFAFLSAKPKLVLFNNPDEDDSLPEAGGLLEGEECQIIRGQLERELAQMSDEEAEDFLKEFNITASAKDRVIEKSYELLGLISFFTVGEDEVRAWTIKSGTEALDAADVIHSDIKKGFIRAEVVSYKDLLDAGSLPEAKKRGTLRLEGKTYLVQNGDVVHFRFNV